MRLYVRFCLVIVLARGVTWKSPKANDLSIMDGSTVTT